MLSNHISSIFRQVAPSLFLKPSLFFFLVVWIVRSKQEIKDNARKILYNSVRD